MKTTWLILPLALLVGCAQPESHDEGDGEQDGEVGTAVSALCSTSPANFLGPIVYKPDTLGGLEGFVASTSPNASYGNIYCSQRYVLEATGIQDLGTGVHLLADAAWADFPLTEAQCPWTELSEFLYGYKNGAWQSIGAEITTYGIWDAADSVCQLNRRVEINVPGLTKARIAAKVHYVDGSGEHAAKVTTQVVHTAIVLE